MTPTGTLNGVWELPPLILYPFNERVPPATLLESSKAALILSGLLPDDGSDPEELKRRLLSGRYAEIRMLFFLGKDLLRWADQCQEFAQRTPDLRDSGILPQSFAGLLTEHSPENVKTKLLAWGVSDYPAVFARGIGLNAMFTEPPESRHLTPPFLAGYHNFADALFRCYMNLQPYRAIDSDSFRFELYASGEYARLLEQQWSGS